MKIKNLINYLGQLKSNVNDNFMIEPINEVIGILENVEENGKYKKMWYKTRDKFAYIEQMNFPIHKYTYEEIISIINEIKREYFPELIKKTITIEIEAEDIDSMAFGIRTIGYIISDISGNKNIPKMKIVNIGRMKVDNK